MKKFLVILLFPFCKPAENHSGKKFPLVAEGFYANNKHNSFSALIDGDVSNYFNFASSLTVSPNIITYDFPACAELTIKKIKVYQKDWAQFTPKTDYYLKRADNGMEVLVGSFWNDARSNSWKEIIPAVPVKASRLIIKGGVATRYGTELEVWGDFKNCALKEYQLAKPTFEYSSGANAYYWNFQQNPKNLNSSDSIYAPKFKRLKEFKTVRLYVDWYLTEPFKGAYAFNPAHGGWKEELVLDSAFKAGVDIIYCAKNPPSYLNSTWPGTGPQFHPPFDYANNNKREAPSTYIDFAKYWFAVAAYYGRNKNVDLSLFQMWNGADQAWLSKNKKKRGLGILKYVEISNEPDPNWLQTADYMQGREIGAMLSACYDGHKGTLGKNVGVKTADTSMIVVMGGLATASPDAVRGIIDWSIDNRGYKKNGEADIPFDIINYHLYSTTDIKGSQWGKAVRGQAPELSGVFAIADEFVNMSKRHAYGKPVWITEYGTDTSEFGKNKQLSAMRAVTIGKKSPSLVVADWTVRQQLGYIAHGISRLTFFQFIDNDPSKPEVQFNTMALVNGDNTDPLYSRRPAGAYMKQTKELLNGYYFSDSLNSSPRVYRFTKKGANDIYAVWMPTEKDATGTYKLSVAANAKIKLWQLQPYGDNMILKNVQSSGNVYTVGASETPVFIEVVK